MVNIGRGMRGIHLYFLNLIDNQLEFCKERRIFKANYCGNYKEIDVDSFIKNFYDRYTFCSETGCSTSLSYPNQSIYMLFKNVGGNVELICDVNTERFYINEIVLELDLKLFLKEDKND